MRWYTRGFSLIEMLIVITLLGGLTTASVASYRVFSEHEQVRQTTLDIENGLKLARSRSQSQKFSATQTCLSYYWVDIQSTYFRVVERCESPWQEYEVIKKNFPSGVIAVPAPNWFVFRTLTGLVQNAVGNTITLTKNGYTKKITVQQTGTIGIQ